MSLLVDAEQGSLLPLLLDLPRPILELIFDKLDPYALCSISRAHMKFSALARDTLLWEKFIQTKDDLLMSATKHCLSSVLSLPPQAFQVDVHIGLSEKFPLVCRLRTAASATIPHVSTLLGINDTEGLAQHISSSLQELINKRSDASSSSAGSSLQPCEVLAVARADRGAVRLALSPSCAIRVIQKDLQRPGWPVLLRHNILPRWVPEELYSRGPMPNMLTSGEYPELQYLSQAMGISNHGVLRFVAEMARYLLQRHKFQGVDENGHPLIDTWGLYETVWLFLSVFESSSPLQLEAYMGKCTNIIAVREHLRRDVARLHQICDYTDESECPSHVEPAPMLTWKSLNGDQLALSATQADLRLMLHLRQCSRAVYFVDATSGDLQVVSKSRTAAMEAIADAVVQLAAHTHSSQLQKLLPAVHTSIKTDIGRMADELEGALDRRRIGLLGSAADVQSGERIESQLPLQRNGSGSGCPDSSCAQSGVENVSKARIILSHLDSMRTTHDGRHSLLRFLLQMEAVRVIETSLGILLKQILNGI